MTLQSHGIHMMTLMMKIVPKQRNSTYAILKFSIVHIKIRNCIHSITDKKSLPNRRREASHGDDNPVKKTYSDARKVVHTISEVDIINDCYRWRKYGQKFVKGNANPRYTDPIFFFFLIFFLIFFFFCCWVLVSAKIYKLTL